MLLSVDLNILFSIQHGFLFYLNLIYSILTPFILLYESQLFFYLHLLFVWIEI